MEGVFRETIISFCNDDPTIASISTTYPYIAKQLLKTPEATLIHHTHDPKTCVEDSWEFIVPVTWFFYKGRLRIPRRLESK